MQRTHLGMDLFIPLYDVTSPFLAALVWLAYDIADKTMLPKTLPCRVFSSFAFSTSFIVVKAFHPDLILLEIFHIHVSAHIHHPTMYSFTSSILSLLNTIQPCGKSSKRMDVVFMQFILVLFTQPLRSGRI